MELGFVVIMKLMEPGSVVILKLMEPGTIDILKLGNGARFGETNLIVFPNLLY